MEGVAFNPVVLTFEQDRVISAFTASDSTCVFSHLFVLAQPICFFKWDVSIYIYILAF